LKTGYLVVRKTWVIVIGDEICPLILAQKREKTLMPRSNLESKFQSDLRKEIESYLPGCLILKNDANYRQGIPDLVIFYGPNYGFLEVKRSANEPRQPNQEWYIEYLDGMSFAAIIHPQNKEEVLDALFAALRA
jgi:hypothetical protein